MALFSEYVGIVRKFLLEKAGIIKRFEYLSLGSELKKQNDIPKKTIPKTRQRFWARSKRGTKNQKKK